MKNSLGICPLPSQNRAFARLISYNLAAMDFHINDLELQVLAHLHESVRGYGDGFALLMPAIATSLEVDQGAVQKAVSYLVEHGLARRSHANHKSRVSSVVLYQRFGVCLTGLGENYMRALENEPSIARKLTARAVREMWNMGKGIIASVAAKLLAEIIARQQKGT